MLRRKRNYLKEIWLNRPWVYIPDVVWFMRRFPYNRNTDYFWVWLRNCLFCNWQVCMEERK